jgi:hypothetical protein
MRTDCTRDNRQCLLPSASRLGFGRLYAKRGNWIQFDQGPGLAGHHGRVLGRVHADGRVYLEIIALLGNLDCPAVRWIDPACVQVCNANPPREIFEFMCGPWNDPAAVLARVGYGFRHADA